MNAWQTIRVSSGTSRRILSLVNGEQYDVRVQAVTDAGDSEFSPASQATPASVPSRPAAPMLVFGDRQFTATLPRLPEDGGDAIAASKIRYKETAQGAADWIEYELTSTEFAANRTGGEVTVDMLTNGTSYDCQWQVSNALGDSQWSPTTRVTPARVPEQVAAPTITEGDRSLSLGWNAPAAHGSAIVDYRVRWALASDPTTWLNPNGANGETVRRTSYDITGLDNGSAYVAQVAARSGIGLGAFSAAVEGMPGTTPAQLAPPSLTPGDMILDIAWTIPTAVADTGGAPITSVDLEWRSDPADAWTIVEDLTGTTYQLSNLTLGDTVEVRLRSSNRFGDAALWSNVASALIAVAPEQMAAPTLTRGLDWLDVAWIAPANNGSTIVSYQLQYKKSSEAADAWVLIENLAGMSRRLLNLETGVQYDVRLSAVNMAGASVWSPISQLRPAGSPAAPAAPALVRLDEGFSATAGGPARQQWRTD